MITHKSVSPAVALRMQAAVQLPPELMGNHQIQVQICGRLSAKMALEEDPDNYILMHAMGANTAGQLGSVIAGGVLLAVVAGMV